MSLITSYIYQPETSAKRALKGKDESDSCLKVNQWAAQKPTGQDELTLTTAYQQWEASKDVTLLQEVTQEGSDVFDGILIGIEKELRDFFWVSK